jgi:hypothetical protein
LRGYELLEQIVAHHLDFLAKASVWDGCNCCQVGHDCIHATGIKSRRRLDCENIYEEARAGSGEGGIEEGKELKDLESKENIDQNDVRLVLAVAEVSAITNQYFENSTRRMR